MVRRKFKSSTLLLSRNFTRGRSQQRLHYLYCIQINSPVSSNNRDLFGLLAFKLSWSADLVFLRVSAFLVASLRDVTGEPLS